jgi:(1->4)-alpha-D-glucan 1-alpha-D-glucosylmutase
VVGVLEHRLMPPSIPIATYRLQLTPSFGFDAAATIVPYLQALGITHVYAAPFLRARAGSPHGYDVVDHSALNPELGGEEAFQRLCATLAQANMGLILDFVPNHMGVLYADNSWWLDVLEWGAKSPFANSFDIDWQSLPGHPRGGVLVPILGRSYGAALEAGEIELRYDATEGSFSAWYCEHRLPIGPNRYGEILQKVVLEAGANDQPAGWKLLELATRYRGPNNPSRAAAPAFKAELAAVAGAEAIIERGLKAYRPAAGSTAAVLHLHRLLERQYYRLAHWQLAGSEINYRRFFDINALAGLRVEDPATFAAIHVLVRRLIANGQLQGLRLDHIDGLRDPHQYFRRLQRLIEVAACSAHPGKNGGPDSTNRHAAAGSPLRQRSVEGERFYVVVEKILAEGERLPRFAGVAGTTGYESLNLISRLLLDARGLSALDRTWREASGENRSFDEILIEAKRRVITNILASEFTVLARLLARIAAGHYSTRDYAPERLRGALELFILHFPIYRTYITPSGPSREDRAIIEAALAKARAEWFGPDADIFDFLRDALTLDLIARGRSGYSIARDRLFAFKVQQFTGPMMAKSLEDTAFYRYHRLLALNEVGGNPAAGALSVEVFHGRMAERVAKWPHGMTATATHDTKRGEDARARLLAFSELAQEWDERVRIWRALNGAHVAAVGASQIPAPAHQYMLYQALLGAWPLAGIDASFAERMRAYAIKAAREGKQQTSWVAPDETYERGLVDFLNRLLDRERSGAFLESFDEFARRAALLGALNSLTQVALKTMMPGVPDFYQGTELWDLSLVDPDNRGPVDFTARSSLLQSLATAPDWRDLAESWQDGRVKFALTRALLALRGELPELFADGSYRPLGVMGPHHEEIVAFARVRGTSAVILVAGRHFARASDNGRRWPRGDCWDASISLENFSDLRDAIAHDKPRTGSQLAIADLFAHIPVAVLRARYASAKAERPRARSAALAT